VAGRLRQSLPLSSRAACQSYEGVVKMSNKLEKQIESGTLFKGEFYLGFLYIGMHDNGNGYLVVVDHDKHGYIILNRDLSVDNIWATIMQAEEHQITEFHVVEPDEKFQTMNDIVP
jgi:hypothetical protein